MYAIRSYYAAYGNTALMAERVAEGVRAAGLAATLMNSIEVPMHQIIDEIEESVITSYSIHYTKLYEERGPEEVLPCAFVLSRKEGSWRTSGMAIGLPVFIVLPTIPSPQTYRARPRSSAE